MMVMRGFQLAFCALIIIPASFGLSESRKSVHEPLITSEGPGPVRRKELFPETKELLDKLEKATSVKDVENIALDDDSFELVDFGKTNGPTDEPTSKSSPTKAGSSCQAAPKQDGTSSTDRSDELPPATTELPPATTETGPSQPEDGSLSPNENTENKINPISSNEEALRDKASTKGLPDSETASADAADQDSPADEGTVKPGSLGAAVERRMQDPSSEHSVPLPTDTSDPKTKRRKKKAREEPAAPTKEQLEETYKYEVLAPPDNSPVQLDLPATPTAQGEEHLSQHVPLSLYCDACMAIAFQLHLAFSKFYSQVTRRPPTESEIYHLVDESCQRSRFQEYGMMEVHGHRHITGPGCNELEAEGGVKHSRGPWPRRLADRCLEVTEDVGEMTIHAAWLRADRDPELLKTFMCFSAPPRDYCERYGHMDAAAETAARRRRQQAASGEPGAETTVAEADHQVKLEAGNASRDEL